MQPAHERHHHPADHDVMKMRDDEIGVRDVHIHRERGEEKPGQPADGEQPDEPERVKHRRVEADRAFVQRGRPVEDFDRRGNRHHVAQNRKHHPGKNRLAADKHVMPPHHKPEHRDGHAARGDVFMTKDSLSRKTRDQLADHAHSRQDHDVNRRMRVEPKKVLE